MTNFDYLQQEPQFAGFSEAAIGAERLYAIDAAACVMEDNLFDVPNEICHHAFLKGILIADGYHPSKDGFDYLFSTDYEKLYIWRFHENKKSKRDDFVALVSVVNPEVKMKHFWKTAGRLIQLAIAINESFEHLENPIDYKWIRNFNSNCSFIDEIEFYNTSELERCFFCEGRRYSVEDIAEVASLIEVLEKDDRAYNAASLVKSSFELHWCCLRCELSKHPLHDHLVDEAERWNQADMLQNLEVSIVQSCRAVESILGAPPKKNNKTSIIKHKEKWKREIGLDPDYCFEKAGKSYLEFYYELFFELRNPSAHSYGSIQYELQRKKAVEARHCEMFSVNSSLL